MAFVVLVCLYATSRYYYKYDNFVALFCIYRSRWVSHLVNILRFVFLEQFLLRMACVSPRLAVCAAYGMYRFLPGCVFMFADSIATSFVQYAR